MVTGRATRISCLPWQLSVAILDRVNAITKASQYLGSRAVLARRLGVSGEAVRKWERSRVPAERCRAIEAATDGAVTIHDLRPDIFPAAAVKAVPHIEIPLTNGGVMLVDEVDRQLVSEFSWHHVSRTAGGHVVRYAEATKKSEGARLQVLAHRLIMPTTKGLVVDHINHDGLDNRRANLRVCHQRDNSRNRRMSQARKSRFKGVSLRSDTGKWKARIMVNRKEISLGCFDTEIEAAKAYNDAAIKNFGDFAHLNELADYGPAKGKPPSSAAA